MALRRRADAEILQGSTGRDPGGGGGLQQPEESINEGRDVVGDGVLGTAGGEGWQADGGEPAGEDGRAVGAEGGGYPGELHALSIGDDLLVGPRGAGSLGAGSS